MPTEHFATSKNIYLPKNDETRKIYPASASGILLVVRLPNYEQRLSKK